jgi:hypothetical protein
MLGLWGETEPFYKSSKNDNAWERPGACPVTNVSTPDFQISEHSMTMQCLKMKEHTGFELKMLSAYGSRTQHDTLQWL